MSNLPMDTVQHVTMRWRGNLSDSASPATAIRLERLLSMVDWRPAGMKPGQVLLIRRLVAPSPLRLMHTPQFNWEAELRQVITDLYRQALRPLNGSIPSNALSVLFEDEAHLLVCLTLEVIENVSSFEDWYWQQVAEIRVNSTSSERLASVWSRYLVALPAALAQLTAHQLERVAEILRPADVLRVLRALEFEWGVSLPQIIFTFQHDSAPSAVEPQFVATEPAGYTNEKSQSNAMSSAAPWEGLLPVTSTVLPILTKILLGWSAVLRAAPAHGRSPIFIKELEAWLAASQRFKDDTIQRGSVQPKELGLVVGESARKQQIPGAIPAPLPVVDAESEHELAPTTLRAGEYTQLGGVFFLINLLLWFGWPEQIPTRISRWAIVEALARALLANRSDANASDAVWTTLAALASRPLEQPLHLGIREPLAFRLPADWLKRIGTIFRCGVYHVSDRILLIDRDRQIIICDVPITDAESLEMVIQTEIAAYQGMGIRVDWTWENQSYDYPEVDSLPAALLVMMDASSAWWIARLSRFVRFWLPAALGTLLLPVEEALKTLLMQSGQLDISNTHIDLYLPMAQADIRLRRAGLDRDPGWVPELGYIIQFHYYET